MKTFSKIDNTRYHLCKSCEWDENNNLIETWKLFVKYDGWMSDGSKEIMSSETNTDEELEEFLKKTRRYDFNDLGKVNLFVCVLFDIILLINLIFLDNDLLLGLCWGGLIALFIINITIAKFQKQNFKSDFIHHIKSFKKRLEVSAEKVTQNVKN